jgi:hypothetical protein
MRTLILITVIFLQTSCSAQKPLKFTAYKSDYVLELPNGYELKKLKDDDGIQEYQALYPDSSVIYITDDEKSGGSNRAKEEKYGADVYIKILANEKLILEGNHSNGKYWKEDKQGKVVVGYFNVPPDKKEEYDKALATLRKKK